MALIDLSMGHQLVSLSIVILIPLNRLTCTVSFLAVMKASGKDNSVVHSESGKVGKTVKYVKQLPYDTDRKDVFDILFNPEWHFESSKDGRPCSYLMKITRSGFKGNKSMTKCNGSFQCSNQHFPNLVQVQQG